MRDTTTSIMNTTSAQNWLISVNYLRIILRYCQQRRVIRWLFNDELENIFCEESCRGWILGFVTLFVWQEKYEKSYSG